MESTIRTSNDDRMSYVFIALQLGFCQISRACSLDLHFIGGKMNNPNRHIEEISCSTLCGWQVRLNQPVDIF